MRAVQLTAYGNPFEGLKFVDIPAQKLRARCKFSSGSSFRRSTRATSCSHRASTRRTPPFQPLSAMKGSAAFSPSGRAWRTSRSGIAYWPRFQLHLERANGCSSKRTFRPAS